MKIISALSCGNKRFREIGKAIPDITFRMLSKELQQLEANKLISRTVTTEGRMLIHYEITEYAKTLIPVISEMIKWGKDHRRAYRSV